MIVLMAWYLADTATNLRARIAAIVFMIPALVLGRMSKSDTFMLALAAALPVWIAAKLIIWVHDDRLELSLRASIARLVLVAAPVLLLCAAPLVLSRAEVVKGFAIGFAKNAGAEAAEEANLRMTLWHQAMERGFESGMLGLGPGPHLQTPAAIVAGRVSGTQPVNIVHPTQNGIANYEAHNTVLDVFTQGGLLGVASFVWLLLRTTTSVYRARSAGLAALVAGAVIFMMTGNIVRQPIFWFAIVLCLTAPVSVVEPHRRVLSRRPRGESGVAVR
jgi:O-antigen ligase